MENFASHFGRNFSYYLADSFYDELSTIINESTVLTLAFPLFLFFTKIPISLNGTSSLQKLGERNVDSYAFSIYFLSRLDTFLYLRRSKVQVYKIIFSKKYPTKKLSNWNKKSPLLLYATIFRNISLNLRKLYFIA